MARLVARQTVRLPGCMCGRAHVTASSVDLEVHSSSLRGGVYFLPFLPFLPSPMHESMLLPFALLGAFSALHPRLDGSTPHNEIANMPIATLLAQAQQCLLKVEQIFPVLSTWSLALQNLLRQRLGVLGAEELRILRQPDVD